MVASYGGDSKSASSGSTAASVTVLPATVATTTVLNASPLSLPQGRTLTLVADVLPASGTVVPTGTVTFYDGATSIGTGTVSRDGEAMLTSTTLTVGTHSLKAVYGGDSNDGGSTSVAISVTILPVFSTTTI